MPVQSRWIGEIAILTLDRPARRNALSIEDWHALRDQLRAFSNPRAVILTGNGGHFCSGMDLSPDNRVFQRILPSITEGHERPARDLLNELKDCIAAIRELPCPTFAAIEGSCIGGGLEIALACDIRIAAQDAVISLPEVKAGMIPDLGGCVRLTRLVGPGRASDLIVTGRRIDGEEAYRMGVVERVVPSGDALNAALEAARMVVANAPNAVQLALNVVRGSQDLGTDEALALETRAGVLALTSGEPQEGVAAFLEKRAPDWKLAVRT